MSDPLLAVSKNERRSEEHFDIRHGNMELNQLVFGLSLVQYFFTMKFWNSNVYPVILELCDLLFKNILI